MMLLLGMLWQKDIKKFSNPARCHAGDERADREGGWRGRRKQGGGGRGGAVEGCGRPVQGGFCLSLKQSDPYDQ